MASQNVAVQQAKREQAKVQISEAQARQKVAAAEGEARSNVVRAQGEARANRPGVLSADEPTGNLDSDNAAGVMDLLFAQRGMTLFLVTHDEERRARCGTGHPGAGRPHGRGLVNGRIFLRLQAGPITLVLIVDSSPIGIRPP